MDPSATQTDTDTSTTSDATSADAPARPLPRPAPRPAAPAPADAPPSGAQRANAAAGGGDPGWLNKRLESARKAERKKLDDEARALGFTDHADLVSNAKAAKERAAQPQAKQMQNRSQNQRQQQGKQNGGQPLDKRAQREIEAANQRVAQADQARRRAEKQRRAIEEKLAAREAQTQLERIASRVGIRDTDYAITLLVRHTAEMNEEQQTAFDEQKFFEGLKSKHAYLWDEVEVPATTGVPSGAPSNASAAPPKPTPTDATRDAIRGNTFDATKATPEQLAARRKALGLSGSSSGN